MSQEIIHVAIVEDNDDLRQMLAYVINGSPGFYCKHTFVDCESAIKELPNTYVHVVLMDIELPGINGIEGVKILKEKLPKVDFIMLTVKQDDQSLFGSLCAGATGYLTKDTPPVQLLQSVKEVHEGGAPMSTRIARKVVGSFNIGNKKSPLSPRESEILKLLCNGLNYRSIADELFLSAHTIKTHIKNIYKKTPRQYTSRGCQKGYRRWINLNFSLTTSLNFTPYGRFLLIYFSYKLGSEQIA